MCVCVGYLLTKAGLVLVALLDLQQAQRYLFVYTVTRYSSRLISFCVSLKVSNIHVYMYVHVRMNRENARSHVTYLMLKIWTRKIIRPLSGIIYLRAGSIHLNRHLIIDTDRSSLFIKQAPTALAITTLLPPIPQL